MMIIVFVIYSKNKYVTLSFLSIIETKTFILFFRSRSVVKYEALRRTEINHLLSTLKPHRNLTNKISQRRKVTVVAKSCYTGDYMCLSFHISMQNHHLILHLVEVILPNCEGEELIRYFQLIIETCLGGNIEDLLKYGNCVQMLLISSLCS